MNANVKKYVVIGLIVLVGGALLIGPLLQGDPVTPQQGGGNNQSLIGQQPKTPAAQFNFEQNLAAISGGTQNVKIKLNQQDITSIEVKYDGTVIQRWDSIPENISFPFSASTVGTYPIQLVSKLKDGTESMDARYVRVVSEFTPASYRAEIIGNPLPHDPNSFTQGLEFKDGRLYEGVGLYGESRVMEVNLQTGEILRKISLDPTRFGEGITILGDRLYQLTWQKGQCLIYDYTSDAKSFTLLTEKSYQGEGWGLCNNGSELILSNGSELLQFIDPETFVVKRSIQVCNDVGPINQLNELEYIDGKIYANIYQTNSVAVIDPATGKVLQLIDCNQLAIKGRGAGKELNGIAKDDKTGKIYMTGKEWPSMFEVRFVPAPNS
ncbi:MAG: glutaminyl-peptide cyclotransferase [bacterium]|nr:glutaminyl-peptide cyclotransferase [bacterium]